MLSLFALAAVPAGAQDGTLVGIGETTTLIGILGGITVPQVNVPDVPGTDNTTPTDGGTGTTPAPAPAPQAATHPLGYYCKGESKRRQRGQQRSPFNQCVSAMAKLSKGSTSSPAAACKGLSRRHVSGAKSTPYALCVAGGQQLLTDKSA